MPSMASASASASALNGTDSACTLERELREEEAHKHKQQQLDADDDDVANSDEEEEEDERRRQMGEIPTLPLLFHHRQELLQLLEKLLSFHRWRDAAGVISQLLRCSPPGTISERQLRRLFMGACEIEKRMGDADDLQKGIKQIFDGYIEQMQSPEMIASAKLEIANFYLSQGQYEEAYHNATNAQISSRGNLAQDRDGRGNPFVNLTLGMICYKRWYKNAIPEDMKIQNCDEGGNRGIHESDVEAGSGSNGSHANLEDPSVFHAHGLDVCLLPVRLRPVQEDLEYSIQEFRELAKDAMYEEGVQCLKNAVHSSPPKSASLDALKPLIQLLLLGDRVAEAAAELVSACRRFNYSAIPFSLRAKFLECFAPQKAATISSCYQAALNIDATCSSYVEGLSRIYRNKSDEHSMKVLLDMIPQHIDAMVPSKISVVQDVGTTIGHEVKNIVWEELASCLLKISDYFQGRIISQFLSEKIAHATWKMRFRLWKEKHFREISPSSKPFSGISEHVSKAYSGMSEHVSISGTSHAGSDLNKLKASKFDHYECDPNNGSAPACNYTNTNKTGGIRMKEHLIGTKRSLKECGSVPEHVGTECKRQRKDNNRKKEQETSSILPLLPGDDELLARKAACACHLYGPSDEYVVEILRILTMNGLDDQISFLQMHMQSALNLCNLLGR